MTQQPPAQQHPNTPDDATLDDTTPWRRVHPISPVIRSWSALLIFVYLIMNFSVQQLREVIEAFDLSIGQSLLILLGIVVAILAVAAGLYAISWRFYQFRITADAVQLHSGVIFRQRRYMRLDRLQAVDIMRPFFARIFGLSKLALHAADGAETTLTLEYVREAEAESLRQEILRLASGTQDAAQPEAQALPDYPYADYLGAYVAQHDHGVPSEVAGGIQPAATTDRTLLTIPFGRVIGAAVVTGLSVAVWAAIIGGGTTAFFMWLGARDGDSTDTLPLGVILLIALGGIVVFTTVATAFAQINSNFNFTAKTSDSGVRLTSGMLSTSSHTIPPGRIQAIQLSRPLAYRFFGWYRVHVTVAGYGLTDSSTTVLPVGTFDDVLTMLTALAPDPGAENAHAVLHTALHRTADDDGFTRVPAWARIWQPIAGRRHGFATTDTLLLIRFGQLSRHVALIPHERIQQSSLYQTPTDKISGTLSAWFITPPGPVRTHLRHQDPQALVDLFFAEAEIAAHARRMTDKNQWMAPDELQTLAKAAVRGEH